MRLRVPPECDGWRLDHFLKHRIRRLSRAKIRTVIEQQVRLADERRPRPALSVRAGETIIVNRPAPVEPEVPRYFDVLAEDDTFLALDKPAGLPMHTTAKFWKNTLVAILRERFPSEALQICHRLDRETSGVLLVARGRVAASFLKRAFAQRLVKKSYLALVHGVPAEPEGVIDRPMRLLDTRTRIMMGVASDGLPALTRFRVLQSFAEHALVEASPETGRQHQIRVHLASIGHPPCPARGPPVFSPPAHARAGDNREPLAPGSGRVHEAILVTNRPRRDHRSGSLIVDKNRELAHTWTAYVVQNENGRSPNASIYTLSGNWDHVDRGLQQ